MTPATDNSEEYVAREEYLLDNVESSSVKVFNI